MIIHIKSMSNPQPIVIPVADLTNISTELWIAVSGKITYQKFERACG
jgi:hypothetical protein